MSALSAAQRRRTYLICLAGWLFDFYDLMLFAYVAAAVAADFHWGADAARHKALAVGLALGTSGLGGIVFGGLADKYGRKAVMTWTILLYSIGTGLCGMSWGLTSLLAFRALTGLGVGGEWATGHALMAEIYPKEERGRASALLQAGEPLGVALAVVMGLWVCPRIGWRAVFFLSALPALVALLVRRHVTESPLWLARRDAPARPFLEPYRELWRGHRGRAAQAWALGTAKLATYWLTYVWLPEYFAELLARAQAAGRPIPAGFSDIRLKFILVAQAAQFLGMMVFGAVSDRFGRRPAFCVYSLLTAAGLWAMAAHGDALLAHPELFWPALGAVGLGSGCTAGFGALLAELFPTSVRNTAMGTVYNLSRGAQFFTQAAMGALAVGVGVAHGLWLAFAFAIFTATWIWTFPETRGVVLADA
ncbi:MAG: MFS transporter [Elusimicrobia bacterium]|nr:MFS transporter [Elusimicrobiota bacterium]